MGGFSIDMGKVCDCGTGTTSRAVFGAPDAVDTRFASLSLDFSGNFSSQGTEHRQRERTSWQACTIRQFMQA